MQTTKATPPPPLPALTSHRSCQHPGGWGLGWWMSDVSSTASAHPRVMAIIITTLHTAEQHHAVVSRSQGVPVPLLNSLALGPCQCRHSQLRLPSHTPSALPKGGAARNTWTSALTYAFGCVAVGPVCAWGCSGRNHSPAGMEAGQAVELT
jgi:hypothetical protein